MFLEIFNKILLKSYKHIAMYQLQDDNELSGQTYFNQFIYDFRKYYY